MAKTIKVYDGTAWQDLALATPIGATGATGANGNTILSGAGTPTGGSNGDFWLNTSTSVLYGPKANGSWPGSGVSLIGPTGETGATGDTGPAGPPAVTNSSINSNTTLTAGTRYFVDTTSARTLTLPASPSVGDEIQVFDASGTAATYNITIDSNSGKINGSVQNAILDVNGVATSLIYTGSTYGWRLG